MARDNYTAVTGDLVGSRKLAPAEREALQVDTLEALRELNERYEEFWVGHGQRAVLTAGDEIQALFREPNVTGDFIQALTESVGGPSRIAFGVGHGALSTGVLRGVGSVELLDGPCFHHARASLIRAKKQKLWAVFSGFGGVHDEILTSVFELMGALRSGWTETQVKYAASARLLGKRLDVARQHDVSPSVVTESLQRAHFDALTNAEKAVRILMRAIGDGEGAQRHA